MKKAVFPGSFDPFTKGHESIVNKASELFDEIVIAIGINAEKKYLFDLEKRKEWIRNTFQNNSKIKVESYEGLTVAFCKKINANYILRGLRSSLDFEYERVIAQTNYAMEPSIETICLITNPALSAISSSIVRDIIRNGGDAKQFVPASVKLK